ncbi:MAG: hypothetical protein V3U81_03970, partial [Candidatus Binatia bacterium]
SPFFLFRIRPYPTQSTHVNPIHALSLITLRCGSIRLASEQIDISNSGWLRKSLCGLSDLA